MSESTFQTLTSALPGGLDERVIVLQDAPRDDAGEFILVWLHHAVRADENPIIDAAVHLGAALDKPVLASMGFHGQSPYNNDRQLTFILEGARDATTDLAARGVRLVYSLPRDPADPSPLPDLIDRSALTLVEMFPAPPFPTWTKRLVARTTRPVWSVDAHCVVPMPTLAKHYSRAFAFRKAVEDRWDEHLRRASSSAASGGRPFAGDVGFDPVDWSTSIPDLVAGCEIDHTIAPSPTLTGGAVAAQARWDEFRRDGLNRYHRDRNDASKVNAVSRLSPYLHHGHIAATRIAREAAQRDTGGAEKFLDELLVWRELAWNHCFQRYDTLESIDGLPGWASKTLRAHADDPRPRIIPREMLERGRTGDRLWDACQRSLLIHGELHNNVRMTWGKAIAHWTESPDAALQTLLDLNHRFALDGSDPNSYGGLLWCLGLFDRAFEPEQSVIGGVRPRSTDDHAARLDLDAFETQRTRRPDDQQRRIAVLGAGVAGLTCARALHDQGYEVVVFDKGRGPGGRTSTRRTDIDDQTVRWDHGAVAFRARDRRFIAAVEKWAACDVVAPWTPRVRTIAADGGTTDGEDTWWVGTPGMNAIAKHLATDLDVRYGVRIVEAAFADDAWRLADVSEDAFDGFDALVSTVPAPQMRALLGDAAPELVAEAASVETAPCWALLLAFDSARDDLPFDLVRFEEPSGMLHKIVRNASKPGRDAAPESWVVHATSTWSHANVEMSQDEAWAALWSSARDVLGDIAPTEGTAHRWRYSHALTPLGVSCLGDGDRRLAAAGDWVRGANVEAAYLSGAAAAGRVMGWDVRTAAPTTASLFG